MATDEVRTFWVLNLLSEYGVGWSKMYPTFSEEAFNMPMCPGIVPEELRDIVERLLEVGALEVRQGYDLWTGATAKEILSDSSDLTPRIHLSLTDQGGGLWESFAKPSWDSLVTSSTERVSLESGLMRGQVACANLDRLVACLGWHQALRNETIDPRTIKIDQVDEYSITYWKRLNGIYVATFECAFANESFDHPHWLSPWRRKLESWCARPWDLPEWGEG